MRADDGLVNPVGADEAEEYGRRKSVSGKLAWTSDPYTVLKLSVWPTKPHPPELPVLNAHHSLGNDVLAARDAAKDIAPSGTGRHEGMRPNQKRTAREGAPKSHTAE